MDISNARKAAKLLEQLDGLHNIRDTLNKYPTALWKLTVDASEIDYFVFPKEAKEEIRNAVESSIKKIENEINSI